MRKYQQLLLLVISFVCVITLLFYRHEYLKLRSVLSVLNFFGSAVTNNTSCLILNNDIKHDLSRRYQFSEPKSVWSKLDEHYIFSSFWETTEEGGFIRSTVIGPRSTFFDYKCRIWFEQGDIIVSEDGTVKYDVDVRSASLTSYKYFLNCFVEKKPTHAVPYGVLWITPTQSNVFSPIYLKRESETITSAICLLPDYSALPKTNIVEFLAYYNTIGINDFVIYDSGIQHSIFPFLESAAGVGLLSSVSVLQWNFPIKDLNLEYLVLKDDCLSRTFGKAKFVGIMSWNDYIVPTSGSVNKMLSTNKVYELINLSFPAWTCCVNFPESQSSKTSWPIFLRKRSCIDLKHSEDKFFANLRPYNNMHKDRINEISDEVAVTYELKTCDKAVQKFVSQVPVPEFASELASHKLLLLWKSYLNTSSIFT